MDDTLSYPFRYRRSYGPTPYISPGVLTPPDDQPTPAFDPSQGTSDDSQNPSPLPPAPPSSPTPIRDDDTAAAASLTKLDPLNPDAVANGRNGNYSGLRQLAKTTMPPPGTPAMEAPSGPQEAEPDYSALPPQPAPTIQPPPGTDDEGNPSDKIAPPPGTDDAGNTPEDLAAAAASSGTAASGSSATTAKLAKNAEDLAKLRGAPVALPTNNWAQRLALAIIAMTKLGPMANQIVHPKWAQQAQQYQADVNNKESEQKDLLAEAAGESQAEYRAAMAQQKLNLGQSYQQKEQDQAKKLADAAQEKKLAGFDKMIADTSKGRESDVALLANEDPQLATLKQQGYTLIPDVRNPAYTHAIPPPVVQVTDAMAKYLPTRAVGDFIPWSEAQGGRANSIKQQQDANLESAKGDNKTPKAVTNAYEGLVQQYTKPDGTVDWPTVRSEFQKMELQKAQASRAVNNFSFTPQQQAALATPPAPGTRNEQFLQTLPADQQLMVKKIADYDYPVPTGGFAMRDPFWKQAITNTMAYDPSFDSKEYPARQKLVSDYTSPNGKAGTNIRSLNTLTGHLGTLEQMGQAMNNGDVQGVNSLVNTFRTQFGHPEVTNFNLAKAAVATELSNALKGQATEGDIKTWSDGIKSAESPEQLKGATQVPLNLMHTRLYELQDQYQRGMGGRSFPMLSGQSAATLRSHGFDLNELDHRYLSPAEMQNYLRQSGWTGGAPTAAQKQQAQALATKDGRLF